MGATWADVWAGVRCVCVCVGGGAVTKRCDLSQAHSLSLELPVSGLSLLIVLL